MIGILLFILLLIGGGVWGWPIFAAMLGIGNIADKPSALQHIKQLMTTHDITPAEIETAFNAPMSAQPGLDNRNKGDIGKTVFIILGAIFILAGISTYIGMFWNSMGSTMRVLVTLGVGYVQLIVLVSSLYERKYPRLVTPLTLASIVFITGGWFVLINEVFPSHSNWRYETMFVMGLMALHFGLLFAKYLRTIFSLAALFFAYGFMALALDTLGLSITYIAIVLGASLFLLGSAIENTRQKVLAAPALLIGAWWLNSGLFDLIALSLAPNQASLIVGLCVMATAYGLHQTGRYPWLIGLGYLMGSAMFYCGLFDLVQYSAIELIYLAITTAILYLCVVLQSRALLLTSTVSMLSYIGYFSAEHFADSLGWPITLMLMGVAFLGVGSIAVKLKRQI